ncbi:transporter substrate-binding domain-containing protein, partial [Escherichia coli]|uniref:transporter substrate-binding domain-containing protein n=1 Tax=Escherichia coli TaxID=562 RepID=UPI00207C7509
NDNYAQRKLIYHGKIYAVFHGMSVAARKHRSNIGRPCLIIWDGLFSSNQKTAYEMALTGAVITDERLKVFDFTPPWASAQHYFVKRAGDTSLNTIADLSGKKVGLQAGSALLARLPELEAMLEKTGG